MRTDVYLSTLDVPDRSSLGDDWSYAGRLNGSEETDLWRVVKGYLGLGARSGRRKVDFYTALDTDSPGYKVLLGACAVAPHPDRVNGSGARVWVALHLAGSSKKILISRQPAVLAALKRRPPEPHPGTRNPGTPVGMRLEGGDSGFFDKI